MFVVMVFLSAGQALAQAAAPDFPLLKARSAFHTRLSPPAKAPERKPAPTPPPAIFEKVSYPAPLGMNEAYVTPVQPGAKRPAILWIPGGFDWSLDESLWKDAPRANDQTAGEFRDFDPRQACLTRSVSV